MISDSKLDFSAHVKEAIIKAMDVCDQVYKLYVRPHLDYSDIIYLKHGPEFTHDITKRLERIQYSATLAVSGA